jgi:hypothetical protein
MVKGGGRGWQKEGMTKQLGKGGGLRCGGGEVLEAMEMRKGCAVRSQSSKVALELDRRRGQMRRRNGGRR